MLEEENATLVRRFFAEVINAGQLDRTDTFVTPTYVEHQQLPGAEGRHGIELAKAFLSMMCRAFPDYHFEIEDLVAQADKVAVRVTVGGTHLGEFQGLAPTGKRVTAAGMELFRLEDGRLAEHWATFETLDMLQQVGMVLVPGPALLARTLAYQARKLLARRRIPLGTHMRHRQAR